MMSAVSVPKALISQISDYTPPSRARTVLLANNPTVGKL